MLTIAFLGLLLFGLAVGLGVYALREPEIRTRDNLEQIEAYGYAETAAGAAERIAPRARVDAFAVTVGGSLARRMGRPKEAALQQELISAGLYRVSARQFLGYRLLITIGAPIVIVWFFALLGAPISRLLLFGAAIAAVGWLLPTFVVHRRARLRLEQIDRALPGLIDLLVVTLEAGVAFTGALRLSAERLGGPLGDEVRLTIQEQNLGLSPLEALENWLTRCDTPAVRSFVRAMVQGNRLGVSMGQILRNQAIEVRAQRKWALEEKAQKMPIKILFPLVVLIFPAMFLILLGPALFAIQGSL